ncbi:HipA domain-containing protein [Vibrio fluvialis]|nr:HipA domain-containing protein [Vibrio fluvialis]MBY7775266.1 HipA domain-containing protein [Vibrio fluvialis]MBY7779614.1 HipA domain-containing protein [Vibrio fluvialis]MBY7988876.1 HipA domain-containing protein [Vibrio fluvialis]MBY7993197.1 HipA domain-containing protein [Vibrio fluvialis]
MLDVIDVTEWMQDEHNAVFPVGARDKAMLWSSEFEVEEGIKPNWPYLFKESIVRYPDQFWTELVAYIVSKYLDIDVPKVFPAIRNTEDGIICGSLIEWFYDVKSERFIHAGSYFKRLIPDFDDKTGKEHNFVDMNMFIRGLSLQAGLVTKRVSWLADMALFDALIGNTDRHQDNWGVIFHADDTCRLSPLFDNGTSLGHERFTERVGGWTLEQMQRYVKKGCHHLRISRDNTEQRIPHVDLVNAIAQADPEMKTRIQQKLDNLDLVGMLAEIEALTEIGVDVRFSQQRYLWIKRNIEVRLELIKEEMNNDDN